MASMTSHRILAGIYWSAWAGVPVGLALVLMAPRSPWKALGAVLVLYSLLLFALFGVVVLIEGRWARYWLWIVPLAGCFLTLWYGAGVAFSEGGSTLLVAAMVAYFVLPVVVLCGSRVAGGS